MILEQKKQAVFIHHSLWVFAKSLPQEDALLIAAINEFRNHMDDLGVFKGIGENSYMHYIPKGGALLLNETIL